MQFEMINDLKQQLAAFSDALFAGKQGCDQLESKVRVLEGKVQEQQVMTDLIIRQSFQLNWSSYISACLFKG